MTKLPHMVRKHYLGWQVTTFYPDMIHDSLQLCTVLYFQFILKLNATLIHMHLSPLIFWALTVHLNLRVFIFKERQKHIVTMNTSIFSKSQTHTDISHSIHWQKTKVNGKSWLSQHRSILCSVAYEYGLTIKSPLKLNCLPDYHIITFVSFRSNCRIPSLRLAPLPGIRIKRIHVQCM